MNGRTEDIGARRLQTIFEKVLEEISFTASDRPGERIEIVTQRSGDDALGDAEPDDLVGPIETERGYAVLQLTARREERARTAGLDPVATRRHDAVIFYKDIA